jgi:hypothetical protein
MKFGNKKRHNRIEPESVEINQLRKLIYTYSKPRKGILQWLVGQFRIEM